MTPIDLTRAKRIVSEAAALPQEQRPAFVERACAGEPGLRTHVEDLLATLDSGSGLFASGTVGTDDDKTADQAAGTAGSLSEGGLTRVGPYRLIERIGEGGFGSVFLAEQEKPVRRQVALKIIKLGMDTREVIARFEQERQALAIMDHPNIAKVFDAGATDTGRPYFVMEFVKGLPITEFCDTNRLPVRDRLGLFAGICSAIQHAHQKGLIHRDIKPSNILVAMEDGKPSPKVIDFGIAKATNQKLTERTMFTELGQFIGTPAYMSPEQAEGSLDIDTRSDIYSLGVLLYELLTGVTPFDMRSLRRAAFDEVRRMIREEEPKRPSTRIKETEKDVSETAQSMGVEPKRLSSILRRDLDWIVMKALEKDRRRRYETASGLAADIQRYLSGEAVSAAPPSVAYRMQKFVKRHRISVLAATTAVVFLIGFSVTVTVQAKRIAREREASEKAAAFLANMLGSASPEAMGTSLWKDLRERVEAARRKRSESEEQIRMTLSSLESALSGVSPTQTARNLLDREILERAGKTIEKDMVSEPRLAGRLEMTLAETYEKLGLFTQAEKHARRSVEIREGTLGSEHPDTLATRSLLALIYHGQGRFAEAETLARATMEAQQRRVGPSHPQTLSTMTRLATTLMKRAKFAESEAVYRSLLQIRSQDKDTDPDKTLAQSANLAVVLQEQGKHKEAEALYQDMAEKWRRKFGPDRPETLTVMGDLAAFYARQGRLDKAEALDRDVLERRRRVLGTEHPDTLLSMNNLAVVYANQHKYAEAEALHREAFELKNKVFGPDNAETLLSAANLAATYYSLNRFEEAAELHRKNLQAQIRLLGAEHPFALTSKSNLASTYYALGRLDEAEKLGREALEGRRRVLAPGHPFIFWSLFSLAATYDSLGRFDEAEHLARQAVLGYEAQDLGSTTPAGYAHLALGRALLGLQRYSEAESELLAAERLVPATSLQGKECLNALVRLYETWDRTDPGKGHRSKADRWRGRLSSLFPVSSASSKGSG